MSPLALSMISILLAATPAEIHFGAPQVEPGGFEIPVNGPPGALRHIEKHVVGQRIVLWVRGARGQLPVQQLDVGPVRSMRVKRARQGTAITLVTRLPAAQVADRLELPTGTRGSIRLRAKRAAPPAAPILPLPPPAETIAAPMSASSSLAEPPAGAAPATPRLFAAHDEAKTETSVGVTPLAWVGILLLIGAGVAFWLKRRQVSPVTDDTIEVVACKRLGSKQSLTLVETCGDRFLLATTDKDVRLLGSVGATPHAAPEAPAFAEEIDVLQRAESVGHPEPDDAPLSPNDLAGLIDLRRRRTPVMGNMGELA